jgi:hypothetical protein
MKIIFLMTNNYFTQKHYNDLFVGQISKEYNIEIWSLLKLDVIRFNKLENFKFPDKLKETVYIQNYDELNMRLKELGQRPIIITSYFNSKKFSNVYKTLNKYNSIVIDIYKEGLVRKLENKSYIGDKNTGLIKRIKSILFSIDQLRKIYWKTKYGSEMVDYCLTPPNLQLVPAKKYIPIHHVKYDEFLKTKEENPVVKGNYAVFLDSNLPYLSDIILYNDEISVEPTKYYSLLNKLFRYIEMEFNIEVIIAPHPKAEYTEKLFNGRKIIKYKTANLIDNSHFVLTHDTTSNVNAILSHKPLVFLYYQEMLETGSKIIGKTTIEYSKLLEAPLIDLEGTYRFEPIINEKAYKKFIDKFIINNQNTYKTNEELILEFLKKLEKS